MMMVNSTARGELQSQHKHKTTIINGKKTKTNKAKTTSFKVT
jgi:hypothetical protein